MESNYYYHQCLSFKAKRVIKFEETKTKWQNTNNSNKIRLKW